MREIRAIEFIYIPRSLLRGFRKKEFERPGSLRVIMLSLGYLAALRQFICHFMAHWGIISIDPRWCIAQTKL
jgi:hypothetical protein